MRSLKIAGVERWKDVEDHTLTINQALTYQVDTCSFNVTGVQFVEGEEVIVEDDVVGRLFAGIITQVELVRTIYPDRRVKIWRVDCDDYTALVDRRLVVEAYENQTADAIFKDIVTKYCLGFTAFGVQSGAPVVESTGTEMAYKRPSECFRWLCEYTGWHWQPDYYKDLHFFSADDLASPAPMILTPGGKFRFGRHRIDTQGLRNRVCVQGGKMLSDPQTISWKADGEARTWTLPWGPHETSLKVGDTTKTVGVENLHDETNYDFMMSFTEKYLRCSAQTVTPVEGTTIALTAKQDIPVITMVDDYESQQAIAKVQGGDGVYEHVITDDSLTTIAAAEAAGMADLREHGNPKVSGSFETEVGKAQEFTPGDWELVIQQFKGTNYTTLTNWQYVAQGFKPVGMAVGATKVKVYVASAGRAGTPPGTAWYIARDRNGLPGDEITKEWGVISGPDWPNIGKLVEIEIETTEPLGKDVQYWIVGWAIGGDISSGVRIMYNGEGGYPDGRYAYTENDVWIVTDRDMTFKLEANVVRPLALTWQPAQIVDIRLPDRGVEGEYLIQRVTVTPVVNKWTYRVEYGGRLLGIADFLQALVSAQQKRRSIEPAQSVQKYVYGLESLAVGDELVTTQKTMPYILGEADCICGLVVF